MASAFLDGINVASLALMLVVTYQLAGTAMVDWVTVTLAILSAVFIFFYKINNRGSCSAVLFAGVFPIANRQLSWLPAR